VQHREQSLTNTAGRDFKPPNVKFAWSILFFSLMLWFHFFTVYPISTLIFNLTVEFGDRIVSKMANFWLFLRVRFALLLSACWAIDVRASMALKLAGLDSVQGGSRARERMWTVVISSKDEGSPHICDVRVYFLHLLDAGGERISLHGALPST
jgi:hypothetical protein